MDVRFNRIFKELTNLFTPELTASPVGVKHKKSTLEPKASDCGQVESRRNFDKANYSFNLVYNNNHYFFTILMSVLKQVYNTHWIKKKIKVNIL